MHAGAAEFSQCSGQGSQSREIKLASGVEAANGSRIVLVKYAGGGHQFTGVCVGDDQVIACRIVGIGINTRDCGAEIAAILLGEYPVTQALRRFYELRVTGQFGAQVTAPAGLKARGGCSHGLASVFLFQVKAMKRV